MSKFRKAGLALSAPFQIETPPHVNIATIVNDPDAIDGENLDSLEGALRRKGAAVTRYGIKDLAISPDPQLPTLLHRGKPVTADAAITRGVEIEVVIALEAAGIPTLNSPEAILTSRHKGNTNAVLQQQAGASLPIPRTFAVRSTQSAVDAANVLQYPVVVKRALGSLGEWVRKAADEFTLRQIAEEFDIENNDVLICEYIECSGRARRIIGVGGIAIRIAREHQAPTDEFRTQSHWGAVATVIVPTDEECRLTEEVAAIIGHGFIGVDLGTATESRANSLQAGSLVLFEVNSQPSLDAITEATGYDFPGAVADFLLAKAAHWQNGGSGNPPNWQPSQPDELQTKASA